MEFLSFPLPLLLHSLSGWHLPDNSGLSCHTQFPSAEMKHLVGHPHFARTYESEQLCLAGRGVCHHWYSDVLSPTARHSIMLNVGWSLLSTAMIGYGGCGAVCLIHCEMLLFINYSQLSEQQSTYKIYSCFDVGGIWVNSPILIFLCC